MPSVSFFAVTQSFTYQIPLKLESAPALLLLKRKKKRLQGGPEFEKPCTLNVL